MLVITRAINGLANGNVAVLKSVIGEITDDSNQARAFSLFPLSLAIGSILASMIGGYLSNIAATFPSLGESMPLLAKYPYFLPSFVAALFPALSGLVAMFWMDETLPPKDRSSSQEEETEDESSRTMGALDLLRDPTIWPLMYSFALMSLEAISYQALLPIFFFTPVRLGGLGFSEAQIGSALSLRGVATIAVQLFAFPALVTRMGATRLYRILLALYIPTFLLLPLLNVLARGHGNASVLEWVGVGAVLLLGAISNMAFACNLIMTNDATPNKRSLGALNGESENSERRPRPDELPSLCDGADTRPRCILLSMYPCRRARRCQRALRAQRRQARVGGSPHLGVHGRARAGWVALKSRPQARV